MYLKAENSLQLMQILELNAYLSSFSKRTDAKIYISKYDYKRTFQDKISFKIQILIMKLFKSLFVSL